MHQLQQTRTSGYIEQEQIGFAERPTPDSEPYHDDCRENLDVEDVRQHTALQLHLHAAATAHKHSQLVFNEARNQVFFGKPPNITGIESLDTDAPVNSVKTLQPAVSASQIKDVEELWKYVEEEWYSLD